MMEDNDMAGNKEEITIGDIQGIVQEDILE
jgi:hypothetical protein